MSVPLRPQAETAVDGWRGRLKLRLARTESRTVIAAREHEGPLLIQRAFYPETDDRDAGGAVSPCHVYIIHPPGGVASGDDLELDVHLEPQAHALLTTPAAGKFYRRGAAGTAHLSQRFSVTDAILEWLPQENIFYPNAQVTLRTIVRLSAGSRFVGWEMGCLGLPACNRTFEQGSLHSTFELWREDRPLLLERLGLTGPVLTARWGLGARAALGTAVCYPAGRHELDLARGSRPTDCADFTSACTLVDGMVIFRALAPRADHLKAAFTRWWQTLRPAVIGREAVPPRIWST